MYYGWLIVGIAMLSALLGAGLNNVTMAVILKPLSEDQGWSRTLTSGAVTSGALLAGLLSVWIGRIADRAGPRVLAPLGAAAVGTLAILLGSVNAPWQFYAVYVPARALADSLLSGVVPMTAVANWFYVKRPRVMGLVYMAVPLGSAGLAILYQVIMAYASWRAAFVCLGVLLWSLAVVPAAVLLRRQPEDLGLLPDGRAPGVDERGESGRMVPEPGGSGVAGRPAGEAARPDADGQPTAGPAGMETAVSEPSWLLDEAMRTPTLWLIVASSMLATVATGGIAFHVVAYYTDMQIGPDVAAGALGLLALAAAAGGVLWGLLAERLAPRTVSLIVLFSSTASVLLLLQVRTAAVAYVGAVLFGFAARGGLVVTQILIARYYGRRSFGAISGFADPFSKVGLGGGPLVAAAAFDLTGSYQGVFVAFAGAFLLGAGLIFFARQPTRAA